MKKKELLKKCMICFYLMEFVRFFNLKSLKGSLVQLNSAVADTVYNGNLAMANLTLINFGMYKKWPQSEKKHQNSQKIRKKKLQYEFHVNFF